MDEIIHKERSGCLENQNKWIIGGNGNEAWEGLLSTRARGWEVHMLDEKGKQKYKHHKCDDIGTSNTYKCMYMLQTPLNIKLLLQIRNIIKIFGWNALRQKY